MREIDISSQVKQLEAVKDTYVRREVESFRERTLKPDPHPGGPQPFPPAHLGHCLDIQDQDCARSDCEIGNIQLLKGLSSRMAR